MLKRGTNYIQSKRQTGMKGREHFRIHHAIKHRHTHPHRQRGQQRIDSTPDSQKRKNGQKNVVIMLEVKSMRCTTKTKC